MPLNDTIINASIKFGDPYDTSIFMLGETFATGYAELVPKITTNELKSLAKSTGWSTGYKVYDKDLKHLLWWDGTEFTIINNASASTLVSNNATGQILIDVSNSLPPTYGQVLTAVSNTEAQWADSTGGGTGGSDAFYIHTQTIASNTWIVNHNLNKYPSITIVDSSKNVVIGDAFYNDMNTLTLTFTATFSGQAFLN